MPSEFPPPLSTRVKVAAVIVLLVTLAYSFVIAGQILLWFVLVGIAAGIYIAWLLVVAVFRLVEAVEARAVEHGLKALTLDVRATQERAIQLYEAMGYRRWGTNPCYALVDGDWVTGHAYSKQLDRGAPGSGVQSGPVTNG